MSQNIFANLRNILAKLFPDEPSISRIVGDAGLDGRKIDFSSSAINIWHFVLAEAEKVDRVEALLRAVENDGYGNNREFQAACTAYRQLHGKGEGINLAATLPAKQSKNHAQTWQRRLPILLFGILLISLAGCGAYWMLGGSPAGANVTPAATVTMVNTAMVKEQFAEATLTPTQLPTSTSAAALPSPTALPQPTATVQPTVIPPVVSAQLCSFAFLVLDDQSEEPIRRVTIAVFVGIRQETGSTDSTGYYLAKLPCSNGPDVEARLRVSTDDYEPYNRSVFLSNETTEILLERKVTPTPTRSLTPTVTPTAQPTATETPMPAQQPTVTMAPTSAPSYPCEAEVVSPRGVVPVTITFRQRPNEGIRSTQSYQPGDKVIIKQADQSGNWYLIAELSTLERGWASAEYFIDCSTHSK